MHDTDASPPPDPTRHQRLTPTPRRSARSVWLPLLVAGGIAAGVGAGTVHGGDRGFLASFCDELEHTGSPGGAATRCASAVANSR